MKLLHVVPSYLPAWRHGGPIRSIHGLCRALTRRGHQVTVYTTNTDVSETVPQAQPVGVDGVEIWYFPVTAPRRLYHAPQLARALSARLGEVDVLHLHSVFLWPTAAAGRSARHAGIPYLISPRGMLVRDLLRRRGRLRKTLWLRLVERANLEGAAALHATSELESRELSAFGFRLPPVVTIPNGVEDEIDDFAAPLSPAVADALERQPLLLFLGRLSWKKGLELLIAALQQVPAVTLAVAGGDDERIQPRLTESARRAGVADRVLFLGEVQGVDRIALLHRSAALALPSHSENFGNVVLEAMAAGTPVVVSEEVGLADEVRRTRCGLVTPSEPDALGAALRELFTRSAAERAAMGGAGRLAAAERYGWDRVAAAMETVYASVLEPAPAASGAAQGAAGTAPSAAPGPAVRP